MKIVEDGIALCNIHIPEKPFPVEIHSAKQLQKYLKKISGAKFKIVRGLPDNGPAICIAEKSHIGFEETKNMEPESIMRFVDNNRLFFIGGDSRGTLLGIYDFLNRELGCVFAQPEIEFVPEKPTIEISERRFYHQPFMKSRYALGDGDEKMVEWCAKIGLSHSVPPQEDKTPEFQGERELLSEGKGKIWAHQAVEIR
ncbi:MAG: hypothetical protein ACPL3Q_04055, partial [Candidatus Ratteibacteria bacterium]